MPLARKDGGQALAPRLLHGGEDAQLVVDHDVVIGGKAPLDGLQHILLLEGNEDSPVHPTPHAGALHLWRLENHLAVGEGDRGFQARATRPRGPSTTHKAVCKQVDLQEEGHPQQLRIVEVLQAIALQSAQIVRVPELRAQLLEDRPVTVASGATEFALQMAAEVGLHGVVVEERIVHVEQEHDLRRLIRHAPVPCRSPCASVRCTSRPQPQALSTWRTEARCQRPGVLRTRVQGVNIQSRRRRLLATMATGVLLGALVSCHYGSDYSLQTIDVPNSIVIADVDGDGTPDLLVATTADQGNAQNPGFANVILGNHSSPGTFHTGVHYATTGNNPSSMAVADLTRSGSLDLAIANLAAGEGFPFIHRARARGLPPAP